MDNLTIYRNDTPTLKFTCTWSDTGGPIDLSGATLTLVCKTEDLALTLFEKSDEDFDKAHAEAGIVELTLSEDDTATAHDAAVGELEAYFDAAQRRLTLCRFRLRIIADIA